MTVQQRLEIYREMLTHLNNFNLDISCLCGVLHYIIVIRSYPYSSRIDEYPEIISQKPTNKLEEYGSYWWISGEKKPRIQALENAIKSCEDQLKI